MSGASETDTEAVVPWLIVPQCVEVRQVAHTKEWFAIDRLLLGAVCSLPAPAEDDTWDIHIDERGFAYLEDDNGAVWYSEVADMSLLADKQGNVVKCRNGVQIRMGEYASKCVELDLSIPAPEISPTNLKIVCAVFHNSFYGSRVWVNIQSIWDSLQLKLHPGTCCGWVQRRRSTWEKLFESLELGGLTLRLAMPWQRGKAGSELECGRCLTWNGLSIHGVVAVFATSGFREGKCQGGITDPLQRRKVTEFLSALLNMCGRNWIIRLCIDAKANWVPGEGPSGEWPIVLKVEDNMVSLKPLADGIFAEFDFRCPARSFCDVSETIHWHDLFRRACQDQNKIGAWLFSQLVWNIGDRLDRFFVRSSSGEAPADAMDEAVDIVVASRTVWGEDGRHVSQELSRYVNSGLRRYPRSRAISMAPDASKIGDKGLLISPIVQNDSGYAMWAAPQASCRPATTIPPLRLLLWPFLAKTGFI